MTLNTFPSVRSVVRALVGLLVNVSLRTKFEVPSSNRSKHMMGPENIYTVGHVTLTTSI